MLKLHILAGTYSYVDIVLVDCQREGPGSSPKHRFNGPTRVSSGLLSYQTTCPAQVGRPPPKHL